MDKAKIAKLCNQIEMIIVTICNTGYTIQPGDEEAIFNRTKAIMDEVSEPPKTNADRIRQMTDEELVEMLLLSTCYFGCNKCKYNGKCKGKSCTEAALEWLKQEVSKDERTD